MLLPSPPCKPRPIVSLLIEDELLGEYNPESYLAALTMTCQKLARLRRYSWATHLKYSQELTARLAHRLGGSAAGDAVDVANVDGQLRVTRGVYGGKATAVMWLAKTPGVVWVPVPSCRPAEASRTLGEVERVRLGAHGGCTRQAGVEPCAEAKEGVRPRRSPD